MMTHQSRVCSHSRGVILRDIKPRNFAIGAGRRCGIAYLFDFGLAKLFVDPANRAHIPFREGLVGLGTVRCASANVHFGREQGRRDDIEGLGYVLLLLPREASVARHLYAER
ncbi:Casein kinase I [Grifola frondosa]|uniref:Casein kinase I n=1 Tax=Grifola frondosa TaxID=5627 RepID=A0A1C7LNX0_GRIFR|nr:Casein kinase I [Grifola frondosa]